MRQELRAGERIGERAMARCVLLTLLVLAVWARGVAARNGGCKEERESDTDGLVIGGAQEPDLPGFVPPTNELAAGSLVIAMDNTLQGSGTNFNLRAYGAVVDLLYNNITVKWVIKSPKVRDEADFTAVADLNGDLSFVSRDFKAGPFVVDASQAADAIAALTTGGWTDVNYYTLQSATTVPVRHTISTKPLVAISDAGGNADIHEGFLNAAGIVNTMAVTKYDIIDSNGLALLNNDICYSIVTEPHFNGGGETLLYTDAARAFLLSGGNMLAECAAIELYETGLFLTTNGISVGNDPNVKTYKNSDTPYAQWEGEIASAGGSVPAARLAPGSMFRDNTFSVVEDDGESDFQVWATRIEGTVDSQLGGVLHYLGSHRYDEEGALPDVNGVRAYLNAVMSPTTRPEDCELSFETDLDVIVTESVDAILTGSQLTYTVEVRNLGDTTVSDAVATLVLDPSTNHVSGCSVAMDGITVSCMAGTLSPGDKEVFTVVVSTTVNGPVGVTASVATSSGEVFQGNNDDCEPTRVCSQAADVTFSKTLSGTPPDPIKFGDTLTYEISLQNNAADALLDVVVSDVSSVGLELVSTSDAAFVIEDEFHAYWTIGTISPGAAVSATITAKVATHLLDEPLQNTACIAEAGLAIDPSSGCDTVEVRTRATGLQLTKSADVSEAAVGSTVEYTVIALNTDTVAHTAVLVSDILPAGITLNSQTWSLQTLAATTVAEAFDDTSFSGDFSLVEVGESDGLSAGDVRVNSDSPGAGNSLKIDEALFGLRMGSTTLWDSAPTLTFEYTNDGPDNDLLVISEGPGGEQEVILRIDGTGTAVNTWTSAMVSVPALDSPVLEFLALEKTWWVRNVALNGQAWDGPAITPEAVVASLDPGERIFVQIRGTVDTDQSGEVTNTALVESTGASAAAASSTASVTINVLPLVRVSKSAGSTAVYPGDTVVYTLAMYNADGSSHDVTLTDEVTGGSVTRTFVSVVGDEVPVPDTITDSFETYDGTAAMTTMVMDWIEVGDSSNGFATPDVLWINAVPAYIQFELKNQGIGRTYTFPANTRITSARITLVYERPAGGKLRIFLTNSGVTDEKVFELESSTETAPMTAVTGELGPFFNLEPSVTIQVLAADDRTMRIYSVSLEYSVVGDCTPSSPAGASEPTWALYTPVTVEPGCRVTIEYEAVVDDSVCCDSVVNTATTTPMDPGTPAMSDSVSVQVVFPLRITAIARDGADEITGVPSGGSFQYVVTVEALSSAGAVVDVAYALPAEVTPAVAVSDTSGASVTMGSPLTTVIDVTHTDTVDNTSPITFTATLNALGVTRTVDVQVAVLADATKEFFILQGENLIVSPIPLAEIFLLDRTSVTFDSTSAQGIPISSNPFGYLLYDQSSTTALAGMDSFQYSVCAVEPTTTCETVTVTVNVETRTAGTDDAVTIYVDESVSVDVLGNDVGPSGFESTAAVTASNPMASAAFSAAMLDYTPPPGFIGVDTVDYYICMVGTRIMDPGYEECGGPGPDNCDTATLTVTVEVPPQEVLASDDEVLMAFRVPTLQIDALANDTVTMGGAIDPASFTLDPDSTFAGPGTFTHLGGGIVQFTPDAVPWSGTSSITYEVCTIDYGFICGRAVIIVNAAAACELPVGRLTSPIGGSSDPVRLMKYINTPITWELENPYPGLRVNVRLRNSHVDAMVDLMIAENVDGLELRVNYIPHHLFSSDLVDLYTLWIESVDDSCVFEPESELSMYGSPDEYCLLPANLQNVRCREFQDELHQRR